MNVNIYYGGRGLIDDPTVTAINKMTDVLKELRVNVERYNLFELKNTITTIPGTFKEADAVILATTVEWFGIGGYMQQFLDACWLYGDKNRIAQIYMFPVVMSRASGEREAVLSLCNAWEILGGKTCNGLSAYVNDTVEFEVNQDYQDIIEKKAEEIYRTISQKVKLMPSSNNAIKKTLVSDIINLTPQETETLSKYAADDTYIKKQKEDIEELTGMFQGLLQEEEKGGLERFIGMLERSFIPQRSFSCEYEMVLTDKHKSIYLSVDNDKLSCSVNIPNSAQVICRLEEEKLENILLGRQTFQGAFMSGIMTARGDFTSVRMLDQCFKIK